MMSRMQPFPNNTDIIIINNQQHHENQSSSSSSSSNISSLSPSLLTISIILLITLLATVSLILLIRRSGCLPICNNQTSSSSSISSHRHVSPRAVIDSLPLFSFSSVSSLAGDCSVCLSKFQPHDQLRLLPLCLHAFHAPCVDSWLRLNLTCPLCRSTVIVSDGSSGSFHLEIGSVSQRGSNSVVSSDRRRSYSMGSFDYVVEGESEVSVSDSSGKAVPSNPPEARLAADVAEERSWLSECMDRVAETVSFRSSGRFFTGSSRRSNVSDVAELNLEAGSFGDEISELFRWAAGV